MRLASKIFLGFSLVIVVLAAVGVLSLRADLARLRDLARTRDEARHLTDATAAFERYRDAVVAEQARLLVAGGRPAAVGEPAGRELAERVESSLESLQSATHARGFRPQAEVSRRG